MKGIKAIEIVDYLHRLDKLTALAVINYYLGDVGHPYIDFTTYCKSEITDALHELNSNTDGQNWKLEDTKLSPYGELLLWKDGEYVKTDIYLTDVYCYLED